LGKIDKDVWGWILWIIFPGCRQRLREWFPAEVQANQSGAIYDN
jgi:hypothetical protein